MSAAWPTVALGEVTRLDLNREPIDPSKTYDMVGVLSFARGLFDREPIENGNTSYKHFLRLKPDHVVMSQLFGWEGALALSEDRFAGKYLSPQFPTFLCDEKRLDREFLGWLMRRPSFWSDLGTRASGMGDRRRTLNPDAFFACQIPLPPLDEQRRLVARIEELAAKVEEANRLRAAAKEQLTLTNNRIVATKIDRIIAPLRPLSEVAIKRTGVAYRASDFSDQSGVPVVRLKEIGTKVPQVFLTNPDSYPNVWLEPGDIILAKTSFSTGAMCIWETSGAVLNQNAIMLRAKEGVLQKYLYAWLGQQIHRYLSSHLADPNFYPYIRESDLIRWPVPVPPTDEQSRIVSELDDLQAKVDTVKAIQTETAAELDAMLPAILDKAFKGAL